ncbi:MAG: sulfatase [Solirubrobacterales bacterium]|nr:sulfatase [Solirubrobacterales bacterium]
MSSDRDPRLSRRRLLQAAGVAGAGAALPFAAGCASSADAGSGGDPENVVVIIIDSLRPDFLGAYGAARMHTPNFDRLIARGVRFNRAYPEAMVTVPARRSIYTGQRIFPYRDFTPHADLGISPGWEPIGDVSKTMEAALRDAGYRVYQVTDNPHTGFTQSFKPYRESYDVFVSIKGRTGTLNDPDTVSDEMVAQWLPEYLQDSERYTVGMKKNLANTGYGEDDSKSDAARVFKRASDELANAARSGKRFALVVDCFDPHEPWTAPPEFIDMYGDPDYEGPEIGTVEYGPAGKLSLDERRRLHAGYAASVTMTDKWLGTFLDRFDELGLGDNTAIVFLADHGVLLGERGWLGKIPGELHPELAQVPFAIVHPDGRRAGESSDYFASTHDVAPTVLALLGISEPDWMNGADLTPILDGRDPTEERPFHYGGMFNRYYARDDRWLLLGDTLGGNRKLYDLTLDPGEWHDVHDASRANRDQAEAMYQQLLEATGGGKLPYYDQAVLERKLERERERTGFVDPTP